MPSAGDVPIVTAQRARIGIDLTGAWPAALAFAACAVYAATLPPVPDHAWQFYMAERALDGARLYVDIGAADMHPPLFTWLAMAIAAFGRLVDVDGLALYPVVVLVMVGCSLAAWRRITGASGWMLAVLLVALLPVAGPYYGQGEHLALVLSIPYLGGAAAASEGRRIGRGGRLGSAVAAGLGLALKPHFALVWMGVEGCIAMRQGVRSLFRRESIIIGSIFALYIGATVAFTPEFFRLLPWLLELYPRTFGVEFHTIVFDRRALVLGLGLFAGHTIRRDPDLAPLARMLAVAALAMYAAMLLQGNGWGYHWYPVMALSVVLCGLALSPFLSRFRIAAPALAVLAFFWTQAQAVRTSRLLVVDPVLLPQMMDIVEERARGEAIVALSHMIETGFPLVNLTGVRWASPYAHLWMVPALYSDAWAGKEPVRYREVGEWTQFEQQMFDRIWVQMERDDPALTIIRVAFNGFDLRAYFETDPRFRDRFARSPVIDTIGRYVILGRPQ
ncbi:MAG: hypothetical protein ACREL7_00320, partial [Longimicrobiales bacterium]